MSEKVKKIKEEYLEKCNDKLNKALAKTSMDFILESIIEHPKEEKLDRTELEMLDKLRKKRIANIDVKQGEYKNEDLERIKIRK